jgi:hypothetical protein
MLNLKCPTNLNLFSEADHLIVRQAMALLPKRQLEAVTLRYWEGLSETEISLAMHTDWQTVERLIANAFGRLKNLCLSQSEFSRRTTRENENSVDPVNAYVNKLSNKGKANGIAVSA